MKKQTPLLIASMKNDCEYLNQKTVTSKDLLDTFLGNTPLLWGIANSSVSFVLKLLDLPYTDHINIKSTVFLNTPLILSISKGWTHLSALRKDINPQNAIAKKLLEKGAEVNAIDKYGRTALHYACLHRNLDAIKTLTKAKSDWSIKDENGNTPLYYCCMSYETSLMILRGATGGATGYTFTLVKDGFNSSDIFYDSLSSLLAEEGQLGNVRLSKQVFDFNQKIDKALKSIYNHARTLYETNPTHGVFEIYAEAFETSGGISNMLCGVTDSVENNKIKALLKLYFELKNSALLHLDFSSNEIVFRSKKDEISQIFNRALKNPELMAERKFITKVGMVVLNLISVFCAGLPLFANYCITGHVFFSHRTKTEKLLTQCKEELALHFSKKILDSVL